MNLLNKYNMNFLDKNLKKNACFIHSIHNDLHKTEKLKYLVNHLNNCGVIEKLDYLFINNIGINIDEKIFKTINEKHNGKIIIVNYSNDNNLFENCTLKQLHFFSKFHPDYNILYLNTIGVSFDKNQYHYNNILSFINSILYCLVDNFDNCIEMLEKNDIVGCHYTDNGINPLHFLGNHWWAKSQYISKLSINNLNVKQDAEFWLFSKNPSYFNIITLTNLYKQTYDLKFYEKNVLNNFKNKIYAPKFKNCIVGYSGYGLCNQLFGIVSCIFNNINKNGITFIILHDFLNDINTNVYTKCSEIIDIEKINVLLKDWNIVLLDKYTKLEILSVKFGIEENNIDITSKIIDLYYKNNVLEIPHNTNLNTLYYDPVPNTFKKIFIKYKINDFEFDEMYPENSYIKLNYLNLENTQYSPYHRQNHFNEDNKNNIELFDTILKKIVFNTKYYNIANEFLDPLKIYKKINVLHLRNENDATVHWGYQNNMKSVKFKEVLETKYINLIDKYLDKNSYNIILSMNTENKVIDYLKNNNYNYSFVNKNTDGREINAIIDLIISNACNNVFIGNVNPNHYNGSTFSYVIYKILNNDIKKVLIDLDNINHEEYVV